jgi:N-acetylmuramoyl-L-alanine amidase
MTGGRHNILRGMSMGRAFGAVGAILVALSVGGAAGPALAESKPVVSDLRAADHGGHTRFVLTLDRRVAFTVFLLADPYRVVIDLPETGWRLPPQPLPSGIGLLERLRYGLFQPGTTRVVLDMKGPVAIANAFWLEADERAGESPRASKNAPSSGAPGRHRLVVDIGATTRDAMVAGLREGAVKVVPGKIDVGKGETAPASAAPRLAALTPPPPPDRAPERPSPERTSLVAAGGDSGEEGAIDRLAAVPPAVPAAKSEDAPKAEDGAAPFGTPPRKPHARRHGGKRIIVIDPGHGGPDPGAIGAHGTYEKHVTLAMAKELKQQMEQTGRYKVVLTRDRDVFLRLRDRVAYAREAGADLFISIHADSVGDGAARGPSVYTLSEKASDREAAELADKENKADVIAGLDLSHETPEVGSILIDLAQRETLNRSAHFAAGLIGEIRRETAVLRNTHRFAGFAVLKAPDVPSVLLELGFLSHPADEKALATRSHRVKLAQAVVRATDRFFTRVEEAKR